MLSLSFVEERWGCAWVERCKGWTGGEGDIVNQFEEELTFATTREMVDITWSLISLGSELALNGIITCITCVLMILSNKH